MTPRAPLSTEKLVREQVIATRPHPGHYRAQLPDAVSVRAVRKPEDVACGECRHDSVRKQFLKLRVPKVVQENEACFEIPTRENGEVGPAVAHLHVNYAHKNMTSRAAFKILGGGNFMSV